MNKVGTYERGSTNKSNNSEVPMCHVYNIATGIPAEMTDTS